MKWDESKHPRDKYGKFTTAQYNAMSIEELKHEAMRVLPQTIKLPDIVLPKSVGAKWRNENVLDLKTGKFYHFAEGSKLQDVEVFAGYGTRYEYRKGIEYAAKIGGLPEEWQHVKAKAELSTGKGTAKAEVHWSQHEKYGKFEFFVKRWL